MRRQVIEGPHEVEGGQELVQAAHVDLGLPVGVGAGVQAQGSVALAGPAARVVARAVRHQRREGAVSELGRAARLLH